MTSNLQERRSEARDRIDQYYSVEFFFSGVEYIYQFKIWNLSSQGMCVVVREDSGLLKHVKVGDVVDLKYHTADLKEPAINMKTEIRHITKSEEGRFKGHVLVGLFILNEQA